MLGSDYFSVMSSADEKIFFRRKLPHIQPRDSMFFVTFRLYGSLPAVVMINRREEYEAELYLSKIEARKNGESIDPSLNQRYYFERFDEMLEKYSGSPKYLQYGDIAQTVIDSIEYWNGKRLTAVYYCMMPNHVRIVIDIGDYPVAQFQNKPSYRLSRIMETLKGYTAKSANKILLRTGRFWQKESYDHVVRSGNELNRIIQYVMNNPVKSGLVKTPEEWKWTYINKKYFIL